MIWLASPVQTRASYSEWIAGPAFVVDKYVAIVDDQADIYVSMDSYDILKKAEAGEHFLISADAGDGWMEVRVKNGVGYLSETEVTIVSADEFEEEKNGNSDELRQYILDYAKQFLGGKYVYGGNDPHTGVDCSGFVRYVMEHAAGVSLDRSSRAQARQGVAISADQIRPGDLVFYAHGGKSIDHVAIYIGDEQIIHASTEKTGIKISKWNYTKPVKIINVLGD